MKVNSPKLRHYIIEHSVPEAFLLLRLYFPESNVSISWRCSIVYSAFTLSITGEVFKYSNKTWFDQNQFPGLCFIMFNHGLVQDGGVKGCALTSSGESTRITTAEQSSTGRHWNSTKKIPYIQRQRRSRNETVGGAQSQ